MIIKDKGKENNIIKERKAFIDLNKIINSKNMRAESKYLICPLIKNLADEFNNPNSNPIKDLFIIKDNIYSICQNSDCKNEIPNNDFYNLAFTLGNSHIQTTTVNNSASTTDSIENPYACEETKDNVFLPSYQDYINSSYGFSTSAKSTDTRYCKTTDWARARGTRCYLSEPYLNYGYYWTRSPNSGNSYVAWYVGNDGSLYGNNVNDVDRSVRPALTINIE